jgi:hypothetical protein
LDEVAKAAAAKESEAAQELRQLKEPNPTQRYKMLQDDTTDLHVRIINQVYKIIQTHSFFKNFSYFCKHSVWTSSPTANPAKEQNEAEIKNWKEKAFQWA